MTGGPVEYSKQAATFGPGDPMHEKDIKTDGCVCWVLAGADLEHRGELRQSALRVVELKI